MVHACTHAFVCSAILSDQQCYKMCTYKGLLINHADLATLLHSWKGVQLWPMLRIHWATPPHIWQFA